MGKKIKKKKRVESDKKLNKSENISDKLSKDEIDKLIIKVRLRNLTYGF